MYYQTKININISHMAYMHTRAVLKKETSTHINTYNGIQSPSSGSLPLLHLNVF